MRYCLWIVFVFLLQTELYAQLLHVVREDNELNKEYLFDLKTDTVYYKLSIKQTSIFKNTINATFTYFEQNYKTNKLDSIKGELICSRIEDLLLVSSDGFEYNPKNCSFSSKGFEYIIEFVEKETDYEAVSFCILDEKSKEIKTEIKIPRTKNL